MIKNDLNIAVITHPVFASLDHPLFTFGGKRVLLYILFTRAISILVKRQLNHRYFKPRFFSRQIYHDITSIGFILNL
jgi:hypothetical protein